MTRLDIIKNVFKYPMALMITMLLVSCEDITNSVPDEAIAEGDYERGPNRGRMLRDGNFALEITIFETGVPPQFRVYAYNNDELLSASQVNLTIELGRHDGELNQFNFAAQNTVLIGDGVVTEPHSFDVTVKASYLGKSYNWSYESYEGRTTISNAIAMEAGLETEFAGPAEIDETLQVTGRVEYDPNAEANVRARFPGQVISVYKGRGDKVKAGDRLATIESNESLRKYDVTSPINGRILQRMTNVGDVTSDEALFYIVDETRLHVDFHIFSKDKARTALGQEVKITDLEGIETVVSSIDAFFASTEFETQTVIASVPLSNPDGKWIPGMTVSGVIKIGSKAVPIAVRPDALQRFRDFTVVYAKVGETYEVRMLDLGLRSDDWVEVLGGLKLGQEYVATNSYLIKADIEKDGASHDH